MITVPPNMRPSDLLVLREAGAFLGALLKKSRRLQQQGKWKEAEQVARNALCATQKAGAQTSRGAALIHLADIHLTTTKLGTALKEARAASRLFSAQPSRYERHNEAIAAYSLGLVHQALGDRTEALRWYEKSIHLLARVKLDWSARNAHSRVRSCERTQQWIEALRACLSDTSMDSSTEGHTSLWLPLLRPESKAMFSLVRLEVDRFVLTSTVELDSRTFLIEHLDGPMQPSLPAEADCYALHIPSQALRLLDAEDGDYALIVRHRDADHEGPGVLETLSGVEFGSFRRDTSGRITFVRPDTTVIGGQIIGEDLPVGYITALLRQTQH